MTATYPLDAWYAAAWRHEVGRTLSKRTVCDTDIVLFRQQDGGVAALADACWHRLMPLSLGTLEGNTVVCGYHGLRFNGAGRCTFMPAQKTINPAAGVRAFRRRRSIGWFGCGRGIRLRRIRRGFRISTGTMGRNGSVRAGRSTT